MKLFNYFIEKFDRTMNLTNVFEEICSGMQGSCSLIWHLQDSIDDFQKRQDFMKFNMDENSKIPMIMRNKETRYFRPLAYLRLIEKQKNSKTIERFCEAEDYINEMYEKFILSKQTISV